MTIYSLKFNFMFKIQNYKYMVYKHILNIEEITYISKFKINVFYFMSTFIILYSKVIYVLKSTLLLVISKMIFYWFYFRHLFNLT